MHLGLESAEGCVWGGQPDGPVSRVKGALILIEQISQSGCTETGTREDRKVNPDNLAELITAVSGVGIWKQSPRVPQHMSMQQRPGGQGVVLPRAMSATALATPI